MLCWLDRDSDFVLCVLTKREIQGDGNVLPKRQVSKKKVPITLWFAMLSHGSCLDVNGLWNVGRWIHTFLFFFPSMRRKLQDVVKNIWILFITTCICNKDNVQKGEESIHPSIKSHVLCLTLYFIPIMVRSSTLKTCVSRLSIETCT